MKVAECLIDTGDFHSALTALTDVSARAEAAQGLGRPLVSVYSDYAGRCEVLRLLLLLLIEPTSQNIRDIMQHLFSHRRRSRLICINRN